jgi:hypothetical protein
MKTNTDQFQIDKPLPAKGDWFFIRDDADDSPSLPFFGYGHFVGLHGDKWKMRVGPGEIRYVPPSCCTPAKTT